MDAIQRSAGVITEEGGLLSHASVVCREFKITCGIATTNATKVIPDGAFVTLDATNGQIIIDNNI
jgi:pyruvate,water dikinase